MAAFLDRRCTAARRAWAKRERVNVGHAWDVVSDAGAWDRMDFWGGGDRADRKRAGSPADRKFSIALHP